MAASTARNREVRLTRHPVGALRAEDFIVADTPMPVPGPGELLVRNRWFRVSVSTRLMAQEDAQTVQGIPFPPLRIGDTLADAAIGEVVAVGPTCDLPVGSVVMHPFGWRDYAVVAAPHATLLDADADPAAHLGHGWTAYAALTQGIRIEAGDTVFVTSGAGAIGAMAGQIAKRLGAGRVIGSTSGRDKADWMRVELGYDAVVTRGGDPLIDQLAWAAPQGIDVIVDMVGGEQLAAALSLARNGARCVILGALTAELDPRRAGLRAPVELDSFQIVIKGITLRGFSACEEASDAFAAWLHHLAAWQRDGGLRLPCTVLEGLDAAPLALQEACAGRLRGVVLVTL
ncbi:MULTISPECIES: MDR family NADP-dependent oxidoreductase [unclassified Methylobacterium]|jgi:NADPH-dependent curcumin reductase CurA|uniref:MDR family NADP-dependent oxidoreductase n=1 Tax=unclassified Methylobacterium TaxID=2615210 RepID=UPI001352E94C|nr:NADP-dependent oxidoreductase [Methylobacterium sp. 2A]MWV21885.1 NADP-dependent oxidoreductase [Methylobacterium sp. 2A]